MITLHDYTQSFLIDYWVLLLLLTHPRLGYIIKNIQLKQVETG